jgi:hypothetical protein
VVCQVHFSDSNIFNRKKTEGALSLTIYAMVIDLKAKRVESSQTLRALPSSWFTDEVPWQHVSPPSWIISQWISQFSVLPEKRQSSVNIF